MDNSKQNILNHFQDICKLQCFVNAQGNKEIHVNLNESVKKWLFIYEFSQVEFTNHIMNFYQIDAKLKELLTSIVEHKQINDLLNFIDTYGVKIYHDKDVAQEPFDKLEFWKLFLFELEKRNIDVSQMKPSNEINTILQKDLSSFVYVLSKMSPGKIKSIEVNSKSNNGSLIILLLFMFLFETVLLLLELYFFAGLLFFLMVILVLLLINRQRKFPEIIHVNGYVTFQDMIDDLCG